MNEVVWNYFWRNFCADKSVANLQDDLALWAYPSRELGDRLTPRAQYAKYGSTQPNTQHLKSRLRISAYYVQRRSWLWIFAWFYCFEGICDWSDIQVRNFITTAPLSHNFACMRANKCMTTSVTFKISLQLFMYNCSWLLLFKDFLFYCILHTYIKNDNAFVNLSRCPKLHLILAC